ncbi:fimbria/pilus outer membrane usher protein, partial [Enterobacter cloacae complex sp. P4RS]
FFAQGTMLYGMPHDITLYGGLLYADFYQAVNAGVGMSLGNFGSVSTDITQSQTKFDEENEGNKQGQSIRFLYSKTISTTNSIITLAGYRYSTKDFFSFNDALD